MDSLMWFQIWQLIESFVTVRTLIMFLSSVDPLVVFSGLLTFWISCHSVNTYKVSLQCGFSLMCFQMCWMIESLVTVWTLIRFLSSVDSLMYFSDLATDWISCHSVNTYKVSLQCGSSRVFSGLLTFWISCHSVNTYKVSLQCGFSHVFSDVLNDLNLLSQCEHL